MNRLNQIAHFAFCLAAFTAVGCQSLQTATRAIPETEDVGAQRTVRQADVARSFDENRNDIQVIAARARWQEGDLLACVEQLDDVLSRDPNHHAALRLMVEVEAATRSLEKELGLPASLRASGSPGGLPLGALADGQPLFTALRLPAADRFSQPSDSAQPTQQVTHISAFVLPSDPPVRPLDQQSPTDSDRQSESPTSSGQVLDDAGQALARKDLAKARQLLRTAVMAETADEQLVVSAATLPLRYNQTDLSIELITMAVPQFEDCAALHQVAGTAYYRSGEFQSSQAAFRQAISLDKGQPLTYFLMGLALQKTGDQEAADWHFRQAQHRDVQSVVKR